MKFFSIEKFHLNEKYDNNLNSVMFRTITDELSAVEKRFNMFCRKTRSKIITYIRMWLTVVQKRIVYKLKLMGNILIIFNQAVVQ